MLKDKLQEDLKQAMLSRDTQKVDVLKGLKSAILYEEVAKNKRAEGLSEAETVTVLKRESKKRQDSIDMYSKGGNQEKADLESQEKVIIDSYLPEQLSEIEVEKIINKVISELGISNPEKKDMGKIIGAVKATEAEIDGSTLAKLVNQRISN
jgi:uncharacterized protein YqeY